VTGDSSANRSKTSLRIMAVASVGVQEVPTRRQLIKIISHLYRAGSIKLTSKGQVEKDYQTPYGVATVARHVSQSTQGGPTSCPLDRDARIVVSSTPRFAEVLSHKY
jgi:hypothetical protein